MILRFFRAIFSVVVTFLFFFGVPIVVFTIASKFFGIRPPVKLVMHDIYLVVTAKFVISACFVMLYAMLIEGRRGSGLVYGMALALLMFLSGALSDSVVSYVFYDLPYDYSRLIVIGNAVAYMMAGLAISRLYVPPGPKVYS